MKNILVTGGAGFIGANFVLHMFSYDNIILAHEEIEAKTNEIPVAQELIQKLGLTDCVFTFDALHCKKNAGGSQSQR
jgi:nucleoside-diphosphate-sugar epimerase